LEEPAFVEVAPATAERHGLVDGDIARVRTASGSAELPVRVTEHIVDGTAFVPFNQPGLAVNTLLSGWFTEAASLESVTPAPADSDDVAEPEGVPA